MARKFQFKSRRAKAATDQADKAKASAQNDTRIPPDPLTAVLPALAALGTIASIAAINWMGEDRTEDRAKLKRKPNVGLRDLESCCLGLQEIFRRFARNPKVFAGEGGPAKSPMKFGVHGQRVDQETARHYQTMMNDIASMLVLASQNSFDVMCAIEDGEIDAPEEVFFGFGEQQERLNKLIAARATLRETVDTAADVADRLLGLVRELKKHMVSSTA